MNDAEEPPSDLAEPVGTHGGESSTRVEIESAHLLAANIALSGGTLLGVGAFIEVYEAAGVWPGLLFILLWIPPFGVAQVLVHRFARRRALLGPEDRAALGVAAVAAAAVVLLSTYGGLPLAIWLFAASLIGASFLVLLRSRLRRRGIAGLDRR